MSRKTFPRTASASAYRTTLAQVGQSMMALARALGARLQAALRPEAPRQRLLRRARRRPPQR